MMDNGRECDSARARWLLVTPARDERENLPALAASLLKQTARDRIAAWIIVDDGSQDGTAEAYDWESLPFPVRVLRRDRGRGLAVGGAFAAFTYGADAGLREAADAAFVMKLDADVDLSTTYLEAVSAHAGDRTLGLVGGVVPPTRRDREQRDHVPGFVKGYTRAGYEIVRNLPRAIGLDVIDEPAIRRAGLSVVVEPRAHVRLRRTIGDSEGTLRGRWRNGRVSRWCGYDPTYFAIRVIRYVPRRPFLIGALIMLYGYLTAGPGPFPQTLKSDYRDFQRRKLKTLTSRPIRGARDLYGAPPPCGDPECCP